MKTRRAWNKGLALIMAFALLITGVAFQPITADAAGSYLKKLKVPMGIEQGVEYPFTVQYAGLGEKPVTWEVTKVSHKKAKKAGFDRTSFVVTYRNNNELSPTEVDTLLRSPYAQKNGLNTGVNFLLQIVRGNTGKLFEDNDNVNVSAKQLKDDYGTYYGTAGYIEESSLVSYRLTVTYPHKLRNEVYLGIGGGNVLYYDKTTADEKFDNGEAAFGKTTMYKKGKKNSRWVSLTEL